MEKCLYKFTDFIEGVTGKVYMIKLITYSISPVISKRKPSSIITVSNRYKGMYDLWNIYGEEYLRNINVDVFEIKKDKDCLTLLFYDKALLKSTLYHKTNIGFLNKFGYKEDMDLEEFLGVLKKRYKETNCPHELGIFLGIPVEDVEEFINCNGRKCLYCGYWKVYKNKDRAMKIFKEYDESRSKAIRLLSDNIDISKVAKILSLNN
ncbi:hypothetical protein BJV85_003423 [Clostridium acetobutylicum]|uniref:DUF3793 family protein n=1 Tax=Clostridium acetobutylicum (strain ATCC 824 / DSM 792 / JCM 1419 / IAM 19013 / LMG 5710 / NBRC 13948 / NRRL B-527 / VKM B-1787 / 2291 / W) TaxID=272562 RepID=Q97LH3_CLOAB|nr:MULTISPECIES: DUF3793 family protein [Clostridium]AAK78566.1 Hypothetical protein CA_C0588 [Clostridium acetobutylicum ATCC 824]ADZ19640.1 Conserved hypothetical protein [Clostridium acetobutylicum EA 2018]AEI31325.1 hypothetical protein SMB_G0602 [Clostridium acetobutylicum DSM 1731]AWV80290.1 DUF3793 family protein [Clostridium acetobutylicum]MBC2392475.1 DUF3793 family protein [Clostridium acetobutylicum]